MSPNEDEQAVASEAKTTSTPAPVLPVGPLTAAVADGASAEEMTDELEEEEELPRAHPSAASGTTKEALEAEGSEYGKYYIGMWGDTPNYGCPYCTFATIDGEGPVELHVLSMIDSGDIRHLEALNREGE